ncbi:MAG: N-acetylneuraminate synthase family protein, partial [Lentisphaeria bacterium]|nr:N-acetylneuraminate synthase family protein [Lentisphaeria bacterium]
LPLCLMHCVGSYPTPAADLELDQLDFFRARYPDISIGFSTHEDPADFTPVVAAVAKGAEVLERHVGLPTDKYSLNAYSSTPEQIGKWLDAAEYAHVICGTPGRRRDISAKEKGDLRGLQRGIFAARPIAKGEKIARDAVFFAMPNQPGQFVANDFSKYRDFVATADIPALAALNPTNVQVGDNRARVRAIVGKLCKLIRDSGVQLQDKLELELSHHYGLERFDEVGCTIITCVNREYCQKIIMLLPGQYNPVHTHYKKEETFHILYGELDLTLDGVKKTCHAGDIVVIERGKPHDFGSATGAVIEEISTTHYKSDSFYEDKNIAETSKRKTYMTFYRSWLAGEIE